MKIVADENMPLVQELFAPYGEVLTLPGRSLSSEHVRDADVLLVRSVTQVDEQLLKGSGVTFVGSATIGVDHVDQQYLSGQQIQFASAPGCNANAVVQYVLSALFRLRPQWMTQTVGIVGCGNVGGRLYRTLNALGVKCRCYDPFLQTDSLSHDSQGSGGFVESVAESITELVSFEQVIESDILCLHTPLTMDGDYPTYHLFNEQVLKRLPDHMLLLNAGRGAVVDNQALLKLLPEKSWQLVLDVWENEPDISLPLLDQASIGTPHIAGYSWDGKVNGTRMVRDAFCRWAGLPMPNDDSDSISTASLQVENLSQAVMATFDVAEVDRQMRAALTAVGVDIPRRFDELRKSCPRRLEFNHYRLGGLNDAPLTEGLRDQAQLLGFDVGN